MEKNIMESLELSSKGKQKQVNQETDINAIAAAITKAMTDAINMSTQQKAAEAANANVVSVAINKKVMDKSLKQIEFQKKIISDLNQRKNCRMYAVPKIYKEYQPSFVVSINGCTIKVPADGQARLIHNRYIDIIEQRLRRLDDKIENMNKVDIREINRY